ncbi:hypothetical protein GBA52_025245 [Prunus armeniaca]|nr:hypothetical protein GBA52_025245 [Prunus armeniaca]
MMPAVLFMLQSARPKINAKKHLICSVSWFLKFFMHIVCRGGGEEGRKRSSSKASSFFATAALFVPPIIPPLSRS